MSKNKITNEDFRLGLLTVAAAICFFGSVALKVLQIIIHY